MSPADDKHPIAQRLEKLGHNIYSVNAFEVHCECGPLGKYVVQPLKSGERYAATRIPGALVMDDEGDQKYKARDVHGAEICKDIVERNPGLGLLTFAADDDHTPTEEELMGVRTALYEADTQRLMWGDHQWERSHDRAAISGEWTRASKRLGAKREWSADFQVDAQKACPACKELIKAEAVKCRYCDERFGETPIEAPPLRKLQGK